LLLQFLADALSETRLLAIVVYRDVDPSMREPLAATVAELRRKSVTRAVPLVGLAEADVASLVSLATGLEPATYLVAALHRATDGNPLFVGEAVRLLTSEEALESITDAESWRRMVPESVRAVIRRRLRHLSDNCRLVLALASVLGREFDLAELERVSDVSGEQLLEVLDEAAQERVITDLPGQPGRMRFAHVLIRDTMYDELTPGRRVQLHRRVGDALEELYADNLEPHLAELAHHFYESARPAVADKALAYGRRAAERSLRLLAYEEGARLFLVSLRILDRMELPDEALRCELLLSLGDAYARGGDAARSKHTYGEAARLADALHVPDQLARAALGYGGRISWEVSRDDEHLAHLLERALAAVSDEDSALRVRLLARFAGGPLRDSTADTVRRKSLATQALEMARRIGDASTLAYALIGYVSSDLSPDSTRERVELDKELIQLALEAEDTERAVEGYADHLDASIELGDLAAAYADLEAMTILADELRQPAQRWLVAVHRPVLALLEGRFDAAEGLIAEARLVGERAQSWSATVNSGLQLYILRREQGRIAEVEQLVLNAAADYPTYPIWRCVLANMLAELGSTAQARTELDALAADGFGRLPFDEEWDVSLCLLAETAARLGDGARAARLYELLLPYADRVAVSYPEISMGPVSSFLGILAATCGDYDDAARHFEDALSLSERIGARPWLAHAQDDCGRLLLHRGRPGDAERAHDLLDQARAGYAELGMSPSPSCIAGIPANAGPASMSG
jgi:tetratricopeptide (TPR) repeat protein